MDYKLFLKVQKPIKFYNICTIYQPSFGEILEYGIHEYEQLLIPFIITVDNLNIDISDEEKSKIKNFDIVVNSPEIFSSLCNALELFSKQQVLYDEDGLYFEGYDGRLNRDNFDELSDIILTINAREKPKKEIEPVFKHKKGTPEYEEGYKKWKQIQANRKKFNNHNELKLEDIINICELGGNSYISIEEICKWSLWRIMNCYKSILGISNYKDSFSIYLVSGDKSLIENKHWTELIKIDSK